MYNKGATPIEKNIIVVDEHGNEYEATYPKRAKGLVKHGRARFIEENKICLLCPPDIETEDKEMSENKKTEAIETAAAPQPETKLTAEMIFEKITQLQEWMARGNSLASLAPSIADAFANIPEDAGEQNLTEIVEAITDPIAVREGNYRHLILLYTQMYNDLKAQKK